MKVYKTNYDSFIKSLFKGLNNSLVGPWRSRSVGLLSVLIGYYLASTITAYYLEEFGQRVLVVGLLCFLLEIAIRYRRNLIRLNQFPLLLIVDNFRIGITYAIVLEAFKLGS